MISQAGEERELSSHEVPIVGGNATTGWPSCLVCPEQTSHTLLVKARIKEIQLRNRAKVPAD